MLAEQSNQFLVNDVTAAENQARFATIKKELLGLSTVVKTSTAQTAANKETPDAVRIALVRHETIL